MSPAKNPRPRYDLIPALTSDEAEIPRGMTLLQPVLMGFQQVQPGTSPRATTQTLIPPRVALGMGPAQEIVDGL